MKSKIDWNEIIPKLKKEMRDSLYLEAVAILSDEEPIEKKISEDRVWEKEGDGQYLAKPGRKYHIWKSVARQIRPSSKVNKFWEKLKELNKEIISYEVMDSIANGMDTNVSQMIVYLWARKFIDIAK